MEINEELKKYCKSACEEIISGAYSNKEFVNGEDIISLTPVTQLNLMIIKTLFLNWKSEMDSLKSPYFDYSNSEVKEALKKYSNVLSKNIKIDSDNFKGIVLDSLLETMLLIYTPYNYLIYIIDNIKSETLTISQLKNSDKYIKVNRPIFEEALKYLSDNKIDSSSEKIANTILDKIVEDPAETHIFNDLFNSIYPLDSSAIFDESVEEEVKGDENEMKVEGEGEGEGEGELESATSIKEKVETQPEPEVEKENIEPKATVSEESGPEPIREDKNSEPVNITTDKPRMILNDMYQVEQKETIADKHQKKTIESIKKSLTLNQRFMFINNLFNGDAEHFNNTIDTLENSKSFQEAFDFINSNFKWDDDQEGLEEFISLVSKKFNG